VHGRPSGLGSGDEVQRIIEEMLEQYKMNIDIYSNVKENIARSLSKSTAIKRGQRLEVSEMQVLIDRLFACEVPYKSPSGRNCFLTFELDDLEKRFN
jgi:DNA mismatch repair protein MutL